MLVCEMQTLDTDSEHNPSAVLTIEQPTEAQKVTLVLSNSQPIRLVPMFKLTN